MKPQSTEPGKYENQIRNNPQTKINHDPYIC